MTDLLEMGWADWMVDTFIYTSLLIALVLLLRRPVSRWCGPQVAYALWALPFLRFIMPPIVLPAWMAPADPETVAEVASQPMMVIISDPAQAATATQAAAAAPMAGMAVADLLLPLWIGGALVFIGWRVREYVLMRRELLAQARPVGDAGKVRLVETPAVSSPVAFGIADKVVALPPAFMAHYDIQARDMAIAHELAHHRGYDLVANIAAQPLLALHWFNPLAWWGWRAMRRDQEAACDARVVAGRARSERAAYAQVIAGFATGDHHLALAAPMACPVLGEKSIIHRLRSLTMSEVSSGRRRLGIAAITTTALVLPLTASISYAASEMPQPPAPPEAPLSPEAPLPPQPPLPPLAPDAPEAPSAEEMDSGEHVIVHIDEDTGERRVIRHRITRSGDPASEAEFEAQMEALERELEARGEEIEALVERSQDRARHARNRAEQARERSEHARAMALEFRESFDCEGAEGRRVIERELADGRKATIVCDTSSYERLASSSAKAGLEAAIIGIRAGLSAIRSNPDIPAADRAEAERGMREAIEEIERELRDLRIEVSHSGAASATALRWQGRMVSPVQVRVAPAAISYTSDEECDEDRLDTVRLTSA